MYNGAIVLQGHLSLPMASEVTSLANSSRQPGPPIQKRLMKNVSQKVRQVQASR